MSDLNLTVQEGDDVYLSITETPAVVTLSQAVISGALASTVTVSNTVTVALDANSLAALESVTVTVGNIQIGSSVSVSNFPATQQVAGTVTANVVGRNINGGSGGSGWQLPLIAYDESIAYGGSEVVPVQISTFAGSVDQSNPLPISGTVTANVDGVQIDNGVPFFNVGFFASPGGSSIQVSDDVGAGLPVRVQEPISGTVTANIADESSVDIVGSATSIYSARALVIAAGDDLDAAVPLQTDGSRNLNVKVNAGTVTIGSCVTHGVNIANSVTIGSLPVQLSTTTIGGSARLNVTLSSATTLGATVPSYGNLYGGSDGTNFRAINVDSSGRTVVTGSISVANLPSTQTVAGTVTANISGTVPVSGTFWQATQPVSLASLPSSTVTVAAMPNGTLTTRFGTPTTASTAFLTTAVTNTSRKYLLIQNVTTASNVITVGIGFTPTTTQGIQLAAGAGITFESSYIPTGAVWVLSSVTASNYTILEA